MGTGFWGHHSKECRPIKAPRYGRKEISVARRGRTGSITLEVRRTFEPSWMSPACVAQAYERVVPIPRRPALQARASQPAEAAPQTQPVGRRQRA